MRNLYLNLVLVAVLSASQVQAQFKSVELKPINKDGRRYYYDRNYVSTPEALQIPLLAMKDAQIERYYHSYRKLDRLSNIVYLAPLLVILYHAGNPYWDGTGLWASVFASFAASQVLKIWSHNRMKFAIERYNMLLMPHPSGSSGGNVGGGLSFSWKLR